MITKERRREISLKYYYSHKEQQKERHAIYRKQNPEKIKEYAKKYRERHRVVSSRWKQRNPGWWKKHQQTPHGRFLTYRAAAKHREIVFSISEDQFSSFWGNPCHYCGDKIETIGLDRVDNGIGYEIGNVIPCCMGCNRSKSNRTREEFISMCHRVAKIHPQG